MSDFTLIKKSIEEYLTFYKDEQSIREWLKINNLIVTKDSAKEILNTANECMINKAKSVLKDLLDFYDETIVSDNNLTGEVNLEDTFKSNIISGGLLGALGASVFFGLPGLIIGGFVGAMGGIAHNNNKHLKYLVESILNNQKNIVEQVKRKCLPILDKLIIEEEKAKALFLPEYVDSVKDIYGSLSYEQLKIKAFLESRNIKYLVHVTDSRNIDSILKFGLLPKKDLIKRNIFFLENDHERKELNGFSAICLSVTRKNAKLINKFKHNGTMKKDVIIYIDASILWKEIEIDRLYCQTNAVTINSKKGSTLNDFNMMFDDQIEYVANGEYRLVPRNQFYSDDIPTDVQAEILFYGRIDPKYISLKESTFNPFIVTDDDLPF